MLELNSSDLNDVAKQIVVHLKRPWRFRIKGSKLIFNDRTIDIGDSEDLMKGVNQLSEYELIEEMPSVTPSIKNYRVPTDMLLILMSLKGQIKE